MGHVLTRCQSLLVSLPHITVEHVAGGANQMAHGLEKQAYYANEEEIWMEHPPHCIAEAINAVGPT